ncbi:MULTISPECIES: putative lipid II flippase FtsW [Larsenimonas]|uniref:Probable peptidoglycan glycosyltransferase FtsW n=1 Tax=Larsenimonas suaedae TaxID=1851019 RepID=A0ABU1GUP7_9GAMM|nr:MULTISPECIES: putative lipid II flippase FtsW [Larsenimonas]MCM2971038.1 putative lipid II flippase FtsW [Larsenimonas suaedae]MCM5703144.1 putative lipid II flippase FtsW [Larsenimonas salina]MDR5895747.1 putative lipid II flippase FtsW [Larsenimonas suaedae]
MGLKTWEQRLSTEHHVVDGWLLCSAIALLTIGWIMVTSASTEIATSQTGNAYYYSIRHGIYVLIAASAAFITMRVPMTWWRRNGPTLLLIAAILLAAVLIVGREVNGSRRWISLGPINLQTSEVAKLCLVVYLSGYIERHLTRVRHTWWGFLAPLCLTFGLGALLIMEPDYGATVVLLSTTMGVLLLAGASLWRFVLLSGGVIALGAMMAVAEPYRMQRITSFLDPWANQYGSGYQLTQALIAFGRGGWEGLGLGNSVQKLFYLPEAHTDFVFSVLAEELGMAGAVGVVALFGVLIYRAFVVGRTAETSKRLFSAYVCYGVGLIFAAQAFVNIAVNVGFLPTKGLTLPLLSYGGSSLIISGIMVGLLLRVDGETRARKRIAEDVKRRNQRPVKRAPREASQ